MQTLLQDLRYGIRMLSKNPVFTAVAVITLALGIGANTAIFSVVNSVLLRPLPYKEPDRLVMVGERSLNQTSGETGNATGSYSQDSVTPPNFIDWSNRSQVFEQLAAFTNRDFNLTGVDDPERLHGQRVSASLFALLGVGPIAGRTFMPDEDRFGVGHVVVLSHELWQRRFGGNLSVIGRILTLDNESYSIIGIMPAGFGFPSKEIEVWVPLAFNPGELNNRNAHFLSAVGRLKTSVTLARAQSEMDLIARRLEQAYPATNTNLGIGLRSLHENVVANSRQILLVLLGAVAFILLIACVNVANLLLARGAGRERELALRVALGAGRWRIVRQLLMESFLLALVGGAAGLLLAVLGIESLKTIDPGTIARLNEVGIDWRVLGFTLCISLLTGVVFGLVPALQACSPDLNHALKESGRGVAGVSSNRLRGLLVIMEVGLSLVLLVGAGLLINSFVRLYKTDLGFKPQRLLTMSVELSESKAGDLRQISSFYQQVLEKVQAIPGVKSAAVINNLPIASSGMVAGITIDDKPDPPPGQPLLANYRVISPDYFSTLGISLLKGRELSERDNAESPGIVVINQTMSRKYWADEDPIRKRIKLDSRDSKSPWLTVVGVVSDIRQSELRTEATPELYTSYKQPHRRYARPRTLIIRTTADPNSVLTAVKRQVWSIDKDQPVYNIHTMEQIVSGSLAPRRFNMLLIALFAGLALVLAAIGIYGVMSYAVTQRSQEFGVRLALGAQAGNILELVLRDGLKLTLIGVTLGLAGAFALTRLMRTLLFGVTPTDAVTFAAVSVVLIAVALIACYIPARRATKVDPLVALRYE